MNGSIVPGLYDLCATPFKKDEGKILRILKKTISPKFLQLNLTYICLTIPLLCIYMTEKTKPGL